MLRIVLQNPQKISAWLLFIYICRQNLHKTFHCKLVPCTSKMQQRSRICVSHWCANETIIGDKVNYTFLAAWRSQRLVSRWLTGSMDTVTYFFPADVQEFTWLAKANFLYSLASDLERQISSLHIHFSGWSKDLLWWDLQINYLRSLWCSKVPMLWQ